MSLKFSNLIGECLTAPLMTKKEPMNIHFQDITCTVPIQCNKFWNKEQKHILKNVSGDFQDRKLTAIIGPSGSGKTTLLDIISGYRIKNVSGYVYVNGEQRNIKKLIKQSCYVMQNDTLQSLVTVQEEMAFVINLKLDVNVTLDYKEILILEILKKFSLIEYKNTLIKNLSLDDRRKLAIALELISDPPILFLDEPTKSIM